MADEIHEDPNSGQEHEEGNQENPNPEGENPEGGENHETELTPEQLRANVTRANEQAAAERVKRQQALADLEEMRTKIGEMKSIEEVDALVGDYQRKLAVAEEANNRLLAAQAAGLPPGWEKRLDGSTYEEFLADAQEVAKSVVTQKAPPAPLPPGGGRDPKPEVEDKPGSGYRAAKAKHVS